MHLHTRSRAAVTVTAAMTMLALAATNASGSPALGVAPQRSQPQAGSNATARESAASNWSVDRTGPHTYELTWTSPTAQRVGDGRPEITGPGASPGLTTVSANGRRVSVTVFSRSRPDPTRYAVTVSGRLLDQASGRAVAPAAVAPTVVRPPTTQLADDPGVKGPFRVVSSNYRLPGVKVPGLPAKVEMIGHVVRPRHVDASDPLVLFLHGRHEACYQTGKIPRGPQRDWPCGKGLSPIPSYLGYVYAQRLLASQGYVTVSISANGINAQDYRLDDGGAKARALLVRAHLRHWAAWARSGRYSVDMSRVILVGHSRGGEGVNRSSVTTPLSAPYTIVGQVLVAPTDFGYQSDAYVPTVTLLPYCDGDVSDLQGQHYAEVSRDLAADDTALHSSVLVMGADHNFFNTQWTPHISVAPSSDDWYGRPHATCGRQTAARLTPAEQRKVGKTYIAGAVHLFAADDTGVLPMFDGSPVRVASAGNADVRSETVGAGRELRRPGIDTTVSPGPTATARICAGKAGEDTGPTACGTGVDVVRTPHWVGSYPNGIPTHSAFEMSWTSGGQEAGMTFAAPLDLSGSSSLDLRTIVDPRVGPVQLSVRLDDADGDTVVRPLNGGKIPALPRGGYSLSKDWGQTLRVPLSAIAVSRRDAVTGIDLVAQNSTGHIWVLDAAAVPTSLPPVPSTRLPVLNLHNVTQAEGDGPGAATIAVPYTVAGDLSSHARLVVLIQDASTGRTLPARTLTIAPHTASGTIDVRYRSNRRDDLNRRTIFVGAFPDRGIATGTYLARATIKDDDPAPAFRVAPVARTVQEGSEAAWKVSLSRPVGYYLDFVVRPVRGSGPGARLTVGDLTRHFRRSRLTPVPPLDTPLWKTELEMFAFLPPGEKTAVVQLPTLADNKSEPRRKVTMHFRAFGHGLTSPRPAATVHVRDRSG